MPGCLWAAAKIATLLPMLCFSDLRLANANKKQEFEGVVWQQA